MTSTEAWFATRDRLSHGLLSRWLVSLSGHRERGGGWDRPYAQQLISEAGALAVWLDEAMTSLSPASWAPSLWRPRLSRPERKALEAFLDEAFRARPPLLALLLNTRKALESAKFAASRCLQAVPRPCRAELDALEETVFAFRETVAKLPKDLQGLLDGFLS